MIDAPLRIGELASRAGVSPRTVDYYTNLGLLTPADRTPGNHRLYAVTDVDRIHLVRRLEEHGIPLEEIAAALNGPPVDPRPVLALIDADLRGLHTVADNASPAMQGLLTDIASRAHSLISLALQIPPDLFLP